MKIIGIEMFPVSIAFRRKVKTAFRGTGINEGVKVEKGYAGIPLGPGS